MSIDDNQPSELSGPPEIRQVLAETWLSRKPSPSAAPVSWFSVFSLLVGTVIYWTNFDGFGELMTGNPERVFSGHQYWRLWTAIFAHADFRHILSNSFLYFILGYMLNGYFGLWVFPFAAWFWGGLVNAVALATYSPDVQLLGSSGVVSWMGGAWLALYFLIYRQVRLGARLLRVIGVSLMVFAPAEAFDPAVSYRTHLIGFFAGVVFGVMYFYAHKDRFRSAESYATVVD